MDKNTQQIPHSLSIKIQGQLLATPLPEGIHKQRQENSCAGMQRETWKHMVAPSAPSSCCSIRCLMTTVCTFGANCCHCCFGCSGGCLPESHLARCHRRAAAFVLRRQYNAIYFHYWIVYQREHDLPTFNSGHLTAGGLCTLLRCYKPLSSSSSNLCPQHS